MAAITIHAAKTNLSQLLRAWKRARRSCWRAASSRSPSWSGSRRRQRTPVARYAGCKHRLRILRTAAGAGTAGVGLVTCGYCGQRLSGGSPAKTCSPPPPDGNQRQTPTRSSSAAVSAWEITTKHRIAKLPGGAPIVADLNAAILGQGLVGLPISPRQMSRPPAPSRSSPLCRLDPDANITLSMLEGLAASRTRSIFQHLRRREIVCGIWLPLLRERRRCGGCSPPLRDLAGAAGRFVLSTSVYL